MNKVLLFLIILFLNQCSSNKNEAVLVEKNTNLQKIDNVNTATHVRHMLNKLHHPQPPTRVKTGNSTVNSFAHDNIQQKRSKSWDMRYHWLKEKQTQKQFKIYSDQGTNNHADPYTKHHPTKCHLDFRTKQQHVKDHNERSLLLEQFMLLRRQ